MRSGMPRRHTRPAILHRAPPVERPPRAWRPARTGPAAPAPRLTADEIPERGPAPRSRGVATTGFPTDADAHLDPWLVFCERPGGEGSPPALFLFGYALHHHRLLGQSWVRTTPVLALRPETGRALTASGSRYALGRPVACPEDLGLEGRVAWNGLVRGVASPLERRWVAACKAARWLGVTPPLPDEDAVAAFEAEHAARYIAWRAGLGGRQGSA